MRWDPVVWGTVGQWASALGTFSAFMAAFYVIRRDARVRRRAQAAKVALYVVRTPKRPTEVDGKRDTWYDLTIKNLSDEPIYEVAFWMVRGSRGRRAELLDILRSAEILMPDDTMTMRSDHSGSIFGDTDVLFRDNVDMYWRRNVNGKLTERTTWQRWLFRHLYADSIPRGFFRRFEFWQSKRRHAREVKAGRAGKKLARTERQ